MQAAQIPLGHLYSTGVQPVHQYSPEEQELTELLFNKGQYIQDLQGEQVGKLMAAVRMPEVRYELQKKAIGAVEQYKSGLFNLYKGQRDKRKLSALNLLEAQRLKQELDFKLGAYHQVSADFEKTQNSIIDHVKNNNLTPEEEAAAMAKWKVAASNPDLGLGDVPLYSSMIAEVVNPKIMQKQRDARIREINELDKPIVEQNQGKSYAAPTLDKVKSDIKATYPPGTEAFKLYRDKYAAIGMFAPTATDDEALNVIATKIQAQGYAKDRIEPQGRETFEEWKRKFDYSNANKPANQMTTIPRDADANGYRWDLSSLPVATKPKWTGSGSTSSGERVALRNADIISVHSGSGQAYMMVQGQKPGDTKGEIYVLKVPFGRSILKNLKDKSKATLDGWDAPLSGEHGETVGQPSSAPSKKWTPPNPKK